MSARNKAGLTPLHLLCAHTQPLTPTATAAATATVLGVMRSIIELPRSVLPLLDLAAKSGPPSAGLSLLHVAVQADNTPLVQLLSQFCPSLVNSRSVDSHTTPLQLAARGGFLSTAAMLLTDFQAFVNARDHEGMTALLFACRHGHLRLAQLLVKEGANVRVEEEGGGSALHMACRAGDFAMVKWLVKKCGLRPDGGEEGHQSPEQLVCELLAKARAEQGNTEEGEEEEEDGDSEDKENRFRRIADWLAAWSLADKMGVSVDEVLAEMTSSSPNRSGGEKKQTAKVLRSQGSRR